MWSMYCQFALKDEANDDLPKDSEIKNFCQVMIEYISIAHIGIYQRIAEGNERRQNVLKVAKIVYPRLVELTEHAIAFNDKYEDLREEVREKELTSDLSSLGESLASRIELEDQLIKSLLG